MNYLDLALKYGGFTSLDKIYLQNKLAFLSDEEKLSFITPPPSVINAYFAELYTPAIKAYFTNYPIFFLILWIGNLLGGILTPIFYIFKNKSAVSATLCLPTHSPHKDDESAALQSCGSCRKSTVQHCG